MYLWPWLPGHIGQPKLWRSAEDRAGRLCWAVGQSVAAWLSNVCILCPSVRRQRVCAQQHMLRRHVHQHPWLLRLWELQAWIWTFCWRTGMRRFARCEPSPSLDLRCRVWCLSLLPDVDECAEENFCLGGVCSNTEGSYSCTRCKAGYRVSPDRQRCEGRSHLCSPTQ